MAKQVWWANKDSAIADTAIREWFNDNILTILAEDDERITVQWSDSDEIELFTKQIRSGRKIL